MSYSEHHHPLLQGSVDTWDQPRQVLVQDPRGDPRQSLGPNLSLALSVSSLFTLFTHLPMLMSLLTQILLGDCGKTVMALTSKDPPGRWGLSQHT